MAKDHITNTSLPKRLLFALSLALVVVILWDLTPVGGNIRFYKKWAECGSQPVQVQSWGGKAWYEATNPYPSMFRSIGRYCTAIEAERAGYSASRYELSFPNLEKAGEPIPVGTGVQGDTSNE